MHDSVHPSSAVVLVPGKMLPGRANSDVKNRRECVGWPIDI